MTITIHAEELLPEFIEDFKAGFIWHPTIDYADNAIYAVDSRKKMQVIIFYFKKFGWLNENRWNSYLVSATSDNITIEITCN
jgi:hypothetical protein